MSYYTVKKLAKLAGITVRTLHHYHQIGLLEPNQLGDNGYRYYGEKELLKLQQILFFKELEFPLEEIRQILTSPSFNTVEALKDHKKLLLAKQKRLGNLLITIDKTIDSLEGGEIMKPHDYYGSFTKNELEAYKKEAKQRWGHTDAYKQSLQNTKNWTQADFKKVSDEGGAILSVIAQNMDLGIEDELIQTQVHLYRNHISNFYDCTLEIYSGLGHMYIQDPRFTRFFDTIKPGLAQFMSKAIQYYVSHAS